MMIIKAKKWVQWVIKEATIWIIFHAFHDLDLIPWLSRVGKSDFLISIIFQYLYAPCAYRSINHYLNTFYLNGAFN